MSVTSSPARLRLVTLRAVVVALPEIKTSPPTQSRPKLLVGWVTPRTRRAVVVALLTTRLVMVEEAALTNMPAAVDVGVKILPVKVSQAPLIPCRVVASVLRVIVPAPLVTVMPAPPVKAAKTGSALVEPMMSWPLVAWPRTVTAPVPEPKMTPPSVRLVAPVPPELTSRVPVKLGRVSTVKAPPTIDRSAPVMSVIATSEPISKLVMLVVVARIVSLTRLVMVELGALMRIAATVLVGLKISVWNSSKAAEPDRPVM